MFSTAHRLIHEGPKDQEAATVKKEQDDKEAKKQERQRLNNVEATVGSLQQDFQSASQAVQSGVSAVDRDASLEDCRWHIGGQVEVGLSTIDLQVTR